MPRVAYTTIPASPELALAFRRAIQSRRFNNSTLAQKLGERGHPVARDTLRRIGAGERGIEQWLLEEIDALTGGDLASAVQSAQAAPQQEYNSRLIRPLGRLVSGQLAPEENMNPVPVILPSSMDEATVHAVVLQGDDYEFAHGSHVIYKDTGIWASGAIHLAKSGDRVELVVPMRTSEGLICRRLIIGGGDEPIEEWRPLGLVIAISRFDPLGLRR